MTIIIHTYQTAISTYVAEYLRNAYEELLRATGISKHALYSCSTVSSTTTYSPSASSSNLSRSVGGSSHASGRSSSSKDPQDCAFGIKVAYNLILMERYMLMVPRSAQGFSPSGSTEIEPIEINGFGTGFLLLILP